MSNEESKNDVVKQTRELLTGITPWPWRLASFGDRPEIEGDFPSGDRKYPCRQILTMGFPHVEWTTFDPAVQQEFKRDAALIAGAPELLSALCNEIEELRSLHQVQAESIVEFQSQFRVMKEAIEAALTWIEKFKTLDHNAFHAANQGFEWEKCNERTCQKATALVNQLRTAITPKGSQK